MSETIFDKILAKQIPAKIVFENDAVLAFNDIQPKAKTHVLVIPKIKVSRFSDLRNQTEDYVGSFFKNVSTVAHYLGLDDNGYRIIINCGQHGCQSVEYLHAHILGGEQLASWDF